MTCRAPDLSVNDSAFQKAQKYELLDPDVRLMLQVRQGNAAAFEKLVEKYQNRLISWAIDWYRT